MSNEFVDSYKDIQLYLNENLVNNINNSINEPNNSSNNYNKKNVKNFFYKKNIRSNENNKEKEEINLNQNKRHFEIRRGDWICQFCFNLNFAFRKQCNKCNNSNIIYIFGKQKLPLFRKFSIE